MAVLDKQEAEIPLTGGMDDTAGAEYQAVTTSRAVTDLRWNASGELEKRPATASTVSVTDPSGGVYAGLHADAVVVSRGEPYLMTRNYGLMNKSGRYVGQKGQPVGWTLGYADGMTPKACRVGRLLVERTSGSEHEQGFNSAAACVYASTTLVTACLVRLASGSGCALRLQAVDIATGTVIGQAQYDADAGVAIGWAVDACENTDATTPGAVITFCSGAAAPYSIYKYRYRAATTDFVSDGAFETNALSVRHRIIKSPTAAGRFVIAYEAAGNLLYAADRSCTTAVVVTTHVGTHSAIGGTDIVSSGTSIMVVSCSSLAAAANVYTEVLGTPATAFIAATTSATEIVLSVTAARETSNAVAAHAVLFISIQNTPGAPIPVEYLVRMRTVTFATTTTVGFAAYSDLANVWAVARACTYDDRAHVVLAGAQTNAYSGIMVRAGIDYAAGQVYAHAIARICHNTLAVYDQGYTGNLQSSFVVSDTVYTALTSDFSEDVMPSTTTKLPQTLSLSRVVMTVPPTYAKKDDCATVASGLTFDIDGQRPMMSQPQFAPVVTLVDRAGGTLNGVYKVIAVYTWVDAAGRLHRSEPSVVATSGNLVNRFLDAYVSRMAFPELSESAGTGAPTYSADIYITASAGTVYYLANTAGGAKRTAYTAAGSCSRLFTALLDGVSGNPQVYSTGAGNEELISEPPPAFQAICTVGDRMFAIDAEDRMRIWFSKPFAAGYAPEWNTANTMAIGDKGVGISDLGGVPTVFGEHGIWQIYGSGPNELGVGVFEPARRLPHEVSCLDALSVCKTPAGVVFRSRGGVAILDNSLQLVRIGQPIAGLFVSGDATTYCKVAYDDLSDEVHVIDASGASHYVFNLGAGKWSQWTQDDAFQKWIDCVSVSGRVWFVHRGASTTDALRRACAIDEASHNAHVYPWSIETPWIRFDGVTGALRVREVVTQMRTGLSNGADLGGQVTVTYQTRDLATEVATWTPADMLTLSGAGNPGVVQNLRCRIKNQRAKQFKITVAEAAPSYAYAGNVPVALRVLYGVTPGGGRKNNQTQNKGTTAGS